MMLSEQNDNDIDESDISESLKSFGFWFGTDGR